MKDESAFLHPAQETAPTPPPCNVRLPLFRPGTRVSYQGQLCTVSHIIISRSELLVHLQETGSAVPADKLQLEPTLISLQRSSQQNS